jgi:branched-subunit amino acid transport protein AzlD
VNRFLIVRREPPSPFVTRLSKIIPVNLATNYIAHDFLQLDDYLENTLLQTRRYTYATTPMAMPIHGITNLIVALLIPARCFWQTAKKLRDALPGKTN